MSTIKEYNAEIKALDRTIADLHKQIRPLQTALTKAVDKRASLIEKRDELEVKAMSPDEYDVSLMLEGNPRSTVRYKERERQLLKLFGGNHACGSGFGYNPRTGQTAIKVGLTKGKPEVTETILKGLNFLLPHILPADKEGYKFINLFEHTLSEHGTYYLAVFDDRTELRQDRYHRTHKLQTFPSLKEALDYCQEHVWYDGGVEEGED